MRKGWTKFWKHTANRAKNMKQAKLSSFVSKYDQSGIRKGSAFLLPPQKASELINDLESAGIEMFGITVWESVRLLDGSTGIAEDLSYDFFVSDEVLRSENAVQQSASVIRGFMERLPSNVEYVSIDISYKLLWNFPEN